MTAVSFPESCFYQKIEYGNRIGNGPTQVGKDKKVALANTGNTVQLCKHNHFDLIDDNSIATVHVPLTSLSVSLAR